MSLIIPPERNIKRVSGEHSNSNTYLNAGRTEFQRYKRLLEQYMTNNSFQGNLLDWGVGCARVLQHFANDTQFKCFGIDIDKENIKWCTMNLSNLSAYTVPLEPPTLLDDQYFNVIISSSVLSHLIPKYWESWLQEIKRVIKNNGTAFISFHGDHSCSAILGNNKSALKQVSQCGYVNLNASSDLGIEFEKYYRNTFYTDVNARQLFDKHFFVEALIPGLLSSSQTVAVLKPKKA